MQKVYLTPDQAAEYTGISKSYLAKLRMGTLQDPGPPFVKIGTRAIRYRLRDLDEWLEDRLIEN